jgi:fibronectin type 3 domain-containing protein
VSGATYYELYRHTENISSSSGLINSGPGICNNDYLATAGTYYYYWSKACNTTECSGFSSPARGWRNFDAPVNVSATDGTFTDKVQVTWNAVSGITYYEIYRNTSPDSGSATNISIPTTNSFDDTTAFPGTQYYYWVKACANILCSAYSSVDAGYRAITPPTGVAATDGSFTDRVNVSWTPAVGAGFYEVWRSITNSSGSATRISTTPPPNPYNDGSAQPGIQYFYWVKACSTATGCSDFSLSDPGYRAITAPTGVAATDGTYTDKVQVSWNFVTGATFYEVRRFQSNNPGSAELIASPPTSPYDDTTATPGIQYYYWIKGCSTTTPCSDFSLSNSGYRAITAPTGVSATDGTYLDRVTISWSTSTGATSYQIWRNTSDNSGTANLVGTPTTSPANDSTAVAGTLYYYWVIGCSETRCSAYSTSNSGYRALTPPTAVSATDGSYTDKIAISWNPSTGATYYEVWHSANSNPATAALLSSPSSGPYNDIATTPGVLHYYWLKACGTAGCSGFSTSDTGYRAITAPTGVTATDGTYIDRVDITWSASTGSTFYEVYRNLTDSSGTASLLGSPTISPYNDTTAIPGTQYYYWVKGCSTTPCSAYSASNSGWRAINAPTGVSASDGTYNDRVEVTWTNSTGATYYRIWRNISDNPGGATMISGGTTSPYNDTTAIAGTLFYYWAQGCNSLGCSPSSSSDSGYRAITAPTGVSASDGDYTDKIEVKWIAATGATFYQIWRNTTDNSGGATQIPGSFTANTFDDITTAPGSLYYYWIKGCNNEIGCSAFSSSDLGYRAILPPSTLSASDGTNSGGVEIAWTNAVGSTYFELWRNTVDLPTGSQLMTSQVSRGFFDTTATPGVLYYYWVKGCSAIVCSDYSLTETGYRSLPAVTGLSASDGSSTEMVEITWIGSIYETYYEVWRSETSLIGDASRIADDYHTILYGDFSATPGFRYYYWVRACNDIGCSNWPVSNSGWRVITPPTGVDASDGTFTDKVVISWNPSDGATYYKIWAIAVALPEPILIATPSTSPYEDLLPPPGVIYDYWVEGCTTDTGCSDMSGSDTGFRMISSPPSISASNGTYTDKVQISWGETAGASYYEVWRGNATRSTLVKLPGEPTTSPYDDTSADPGVLYDYQVLACNMETGCSAYSDPASGYRAILAPTSISASDGTFTEKVEVQWVPANGATYYELWRSLVNDSSEANYLGEAYGISGDDTTAVAGVLYYYWVKGCSPIVCSSFSDSDSGYREIAMDHKVFLPLIIR